MCEKMFEMVGEANVMKLGPLLSINLTLVGDADLRNAMCT